MSDYQKKFKSHAVINSNKTALKEYKLSKSVRDKQRKVISEMQTEIENLKSSQNDIIEFLEKELGYGKKF